MAQCPVARYILYFQVTELNLDNCKATSIEGLSGAFVNLEALSLINVGLTSLKGFPSLPKLKRVCSSDFQLLDVSLKTSNTVN